MCWYAYLCVYGWFSVLSEQMGYVSQSPLSQRKEVNGLSAHVYACVCVNSLGLKDCPPTNIKNPFFYTIHWRCDIKQSLAHGTYLSLHVCLCCCLSVRAFSKMSAISLLFSCSVSSSSTTANSSWVCKQTQSVYNFKLEITQNQFRSVSQLCSTTLYYTLYKSLGSVVSIFCLFVS